MHWSEIELRSGAAESAGRWRETTEQTFAKSRGTGFLPQLLGWFMLLTGPGIVLEHLGWVDFGDQPSIVPDWEGVLLGVMGAWMGAAFCLGRAGAEVEAHARLATQWWGVGPWRLWRKSEPLGSFHAVRVHPRFITQGSFPSLRWCVSLVQGEGIAGLDEFLLHHVEGEPAAKALAHELAESIGSTVEVVTELTPPQDLRRALNERARSLRK